MKYLILVFISIVCVSCTVLSQRSSGTSKTVKLDLILEGESNDFFLNLTNNLSEEIIIEGFFSMFNRLVFVDDVTGKEYHDYYSPRKGDIIVMPGEEVSWKYGGYLNLIKRIKRINGGNKVKIYWEIYDKSKKKTPPEYSTEYEDYYQVYRSNELLF